MKDMQAAGTRARVGLIREILPVVDNLERALSVAPQGEGDAFVEGVRLVYRELEGALARAGVEAIEPMGDAFDPNVHEALSMRPQEGAESGTVVDVVEKGYRTADTVVRPARVVVAS
jgi:molecular chaperone GrpE